MKKLFLLILWIWFVLFPLSIGTASEDPLYVSGYDWGGWSESSKLYFVLGWLKSGIEARRSLPFNANKWDESIEYGDLATNFFKENGIIFVGGVSIGQIIDTINEIYSDPRIKTMDITEIMPLASGRLVLGWTVKELDEVIAIKVRLMQCEKQEKGKGRSLEECIPIRGERNSYLQKLKKK